MKKEGALVFVVVAGVAWTSFPLTKGPNQRASLAHEELTREPSLQNHRLQFYLGTRNKRQFVVGGMFGWM